MLTATNLTFTYPRRRHQPVPVLESVSVAVRNGTILGLLGPNGSGKTTLLKLLAGLLTPNAGTIHLDGQLLQSLSRREIARRIAVVPQEAHGAFDFSVLDTVLMGRYPHLGAFQLEGADDIHIAREALAATGTAPLEARLFSTLSGGERQRVVIAGALAQGGEIILLDEPTSSLDLRYQLEISALVARISRERGTTVILSTHDLNLAAGLCHEVVLLNAGRVIAQGPPATTLTASHIRSVYGIDAEVAYHPRAGHLLVVPIGQDA